MAYSQEPQMFLDYHRTQPVDTAMYHHSEYLMEELGWDNTFDPDLRRVDTPMYGWNEQPLERYLQQEDKPLISIDRVHNFQNQPFHLEANRPYNVTGPLPGHSDISSQEQSDCSSMSPKEENEWATDVSQNYHQSFVPDFTQSFSGSDSFYNTAPQTPQPLTICMHAVQPFLDSEDIFPQDEGFADDYENTLGGQSIDDCAIKQEYHSRSHSQANDSAMGQSLKDEAFPDHDSTIIVKEDSELVNTTKDKDSGAENDNSDEDAEAEDEDEDPTIAVIANEEDNTDIDTTYNPRSSTRPKRSRPSPTKSPVKKSRVSKSSPKTKPQFPCKFCDHVSKDIQTLQRHTATIHTRPFVCTFAWADCSSTFGSKNEWKRHVSSQHLGLTYYRCKEGNCGKESTNNTKSTNARVSAVFNRKDLFTQHLRRMHSPFAVKHQGRKNTEWEVKVKQLQSTCLIQNRLPPQKAICPLSGCDAKFEGEKCWDERMEHVGKHLESMAERKKVLPVEVGDSVLVEWALRERIVERVRNGGYKLVAGGEVDADVDVDADGEDVDE